MWPGQFNPITGSWPDKRFVLEVVMWLDMCVCLPLTILIIYCVFCMVQKDQVPVIYYTNLLISNPIQMCIMIAWVLRLESNFCFATYLVSVVASLYFKTCMALERYFFIAHPLLDCLRQTKGSVLVSVLVWTLCITSVPLTIFLGEPSRLTVYALLPSLVFIFCLAGTFKALPAATSVPTEEKRRILGTLVLLFINYFVLIVPACLFWVFNYIRHPLHTSVFEIFFLFSPFVDLILFVFMRKGPIDKLLACLCCCSVDSSEEDTEELTADLKSD